MENSSILANNAWTINDFNLHKWHGMLLTSFHISNVFILQNFDVHTHTNPFRIEWCSFESAEKMDMNEQKICIDSIYFVLEIAFSFPYNNVTLLRNCDHNMLWQTNVFFLSKKTSTNQLVIFIFFWRILACMHSRAYIHRKSKRR